MAGGSIVAVILLVAIGYGFRRCYLDSISKPPIQKKPDAEMVFVPCPGDCGRQLMIVKGTEPKSCLHCWLIGLEYEK